MTQCDRRGGTRNRRRPGTRCPGPGAPSGFDALQAAVLCAKLILLAAGVALAGALMWPKTYPAWAEVLFPSTQERRAGFLREDRSLTTRLVLMRSWAVLGPVAAQQGAPGFWLDIKILVLTVLTLLRRHGAW